MGDHFCTWCHKVLAVGKIHKCPKRPHWVKRGEKRQEALEKARRAEGYR